MGSQSRTRLSGCVHADVGVQPGLPPCGREGRANLAQEGQPWRDISKLLLVPGGPVPAVSQPQSPWQALFPSLGLRAPGWAARSPLPRGWGRGEAGRVLKERCSHCAFIGAPELCELPPVPAPVAGLAAHCCTVENVVFRQPSERAGFWDHPQNVPTGLVLLRHGHQGLGVKLGLCSGWGSGLK